MCHFQDRNRDRDVLKKGETFTRSRPEFRHRRGILHSVFLYYLLAWLLWGLDFFHEFKECPNYFTCNEKLFDH